jgi:hypothetical protein
MRSAPFDIHIEDAVLNPELTAHLEWIRREGIHGFAGHPLIFREEILGVLGAFGRTPFLEEHFKWLRLFADQVAVSIFPRSNWSLRSMMLRRSKSAPTDRRQDPRSQQCCRVVGHAPNDSYVENRRTANPTALDLPVGG